MSMEVIAVYRESVIKTYGFHIVPDLGLVILSFPRNRLTDRGELLQGMGCKEGLHFATLQIEENDTFVLSVCAHLETVERLAALAARDGGEQSIDVQPRVDLLFFHGPHFGDRYGIADAAFGILDRENVPLLAAGCSVSSLYMVFPHGQAQRAASLLMEPFCAPGSDQTGTTGG